MCGIRAIENLWVAAAIKRFLNGETDGAPLLRALYGATAHEPVPERLLDLLRRHHPADLVAPAEESRGTAAARPKLPG